MTDNAKQAWSDVGERFASWGQRVADRYKDAARTEDEEAEAKREIERVAREVIDGVSRGVTAIGGTLRDQEATDELKSAVSALGDAITATVNEATEGIRSRGAGSGGDTATAAPEGDVESTGEPADAAPAGDAESDAGAVEAQPDEEGDEPAP